MPTNERNPEHPTTKAMHEHWDKALACLMVKLGIDEVRLSIFDLANLENKFGGETPTIVVSESGDQLRLRLLPDSKARELARKDGQNL